MDQNLPALLEQAQTKLAAAKTSAELLEARAEADVAYAVAREQSRLARKLQAHSQLTESIHKTQADLLHVIAQANIRLADEYDAAKKDNEVAPPGRPKTLSDGKGFLPTTKDLKLSYKEIHEARQTRDAERTEPGVIGRVLNQLIKEGHEPTKARLRKAVNETLGKPERRPQPNYHPAKEHKKEQDDPDYYAMMEIMSACWQITDCAAEYTPEQVIQGFLTEGSRRDTMDLIDKAIQYLLDVKKANEVYHAAQREPEGRSAVLDFGDLRRSTRSRRQSKSH